ncbi:VWA domain-containing protein [Polynucleobacter sp. MWH-UH19D]|uniref:vWA domain-containing protein n=1 Tax=Polynucleobacter sp. MWH-UH19D TaxID=1855610 RepID=UPI003365018B
MLIQFFLNLKEAKVPVSVREFLTLLEALKSGVIDPSIDEFYQLSRMTLVKDEQYFDRFDQVFGSYFKGVEQIIALSPDIPVDWLEKKLQRVLSEEEKAALQKLGGPEALRKRLEELLKEQKEWHGGGNKWIGAGGSSPFGHSGYHPEGIRIGGESAGNRTAIKVWETRAFKDYDSNLALGTRNIKVALRRLRRFARQGSALELDLDKTIHSTAANAGMLDIQMRPERHNQVKVLLLMDVGGSMDDHIQRIAELFSAAKAEFKHLEHYYFHNCVYEHLWQSNRRRRDQVTATQDIINKYSPDYKLIFVGDATMSPYEILSPNGSVEYNNKEAGAAWINRLIDHFPHFAWLNPEPESIWEYRQSIDIMKNLMKDRMYPVTLNGLESAMRQLSK